MFHCFLDDFAKDHQRGYVDGWMGTLLVSGKKNGEGMSWSAEKTADGLAQNTSPQAVGAGRGLPRRPSAVPPFKVRISVVEFWIGSDKGNYLKC